MRLSIVSDNNNNVKNNRKIKLVQITKNPTEVRKC